jgi:SAM-dependent methyltransferase
MGKHSFIDVLSSHHLAQGIRFLHEAGILSALKSPRTPDDLAVDFGVDQELLAGLLWYLDEHTDLLQQPEPQSYQLADGYQTYRKCGFLVEQYLGAYGFSNGDLGKVFRQPSLGSSFVDRKRHARAYEDLEGSGFPFLGKLIQQLGTPATLELGCGTGNLLLELAAAEPDFFGVGLDLNPNMCAAFRERVKAEGFGDRLVVLEGDASDPAQTVPREIAESIQLVAAVSLANEFFARGEEEQPLEAWLKRLAEHFPGRRLLVVDYYGRLGRDGYTASPMVLLHDWVQMVSGQGIPPSDSSGWAALYEQAGCTLLDTMEPAASKIPFFVHLVALPPEKEEG